MKRPLVAILVLTACARAEPVTSPATLPEPTPARPPAPGGLEMESARASHTATLLADGTVLLVGGEDVVTREPIASVERFDPRTRTFIDAADLPEPRSNHQAIRLRDGRVLVVGGGRSAPIGVGAGIDVMATALTYDGGNDRWTAVGDMHEGRSHFGAAMLPSGRVLVMGGASGRHEHNSQCTGVPDCGPLGDSLASAEIFDPQTNAFSVTGSLREARTSFAVAVLADGRPLVASGVNDCRVGHTSTEVFEEERGRWSDGPALDHGRVFLSAALLPSGRVLVAGGKIPNTRIVAYAERVDVAGGAAAQTAALAVPSTVLVLVPLESGEILSVGGFNCSDGCASHATVERYSETAEAWTALPPLREARACHTATRLVDGRVLVCGGFGDATLRSCEFVAPYP